MRRQGTAQLNSILSLSYLPSIDGLRACSVLAVILYHYGIPGSPAGLGVLAFFVLSGFLITWLLLKERERRGTVSIAGFYKRRVLRIFPAFYCFWTLTILLMSIRHQAIPWGHALSAFAYVSDYYNAILRPPASNFSHTWSLSIEEQFYLFWPLVVYLFGNGLRELNRFVVVFIGAVWIYRPILRLGFGFSQSYIYNAFDTRVDNIMVGCLLAIVLKRGTLTKLWDWLYSRPYVSFLTVALLGISTHFDNSNLYRDLVGLAIEPLLVGLVLVQALMGSDGIWSWLQWGPMRYLGRISYSMYLYQQLTLYPVRRAFSAFPTWIGLAAGIAVTVAVASVSYYLVEQPFLRWKTRLEANRLKVASRHL